MQRQSTKLRALLRAKTFLHMPSVYNTLGARLVESLGFEAIWGVEHHFTDYTMCPDVLQ